MLKNRIRRLQRRLQQESDRSGQENLAKIKAHPEGMAMMSRLLELAPGLDQQTILANPEACELSCRIWEIVATGDYDRFPCPATA